MVGVTCLIYINNPSKHCGAEYFLALGDYVVIFMDVFGWRSKSRIS